MEVTIVNTSLKWRSRCSGFWFGPVLLQLLRNACARMSHLNMHFP